MPKLRIWKGAFSKMNESSNNSFLSGGKNGFEKAKLSLYCDLRSIGWIITNGSEIIKSGIKRINVDFDTYYEFIAGNVISKRINRRLKRTARRNRWRRNSRKQSLINLLQELDMMPTTEMLNMSKSTRLKLRVKALTQKVEPKELGLIFYDLQKKRGYKSMRGVMADGSDYLEEIKKHEENLKSYPSIAAYLLTLDSDKDVILARKSYEVEFDKICQAQEFDNKQLRSILYFQRPLKKGAIGNCSLEPNRKVTHKSHPDYQTFRCYRDANNIVIITPDMKEVEIPIEIRKIWFDRLIDGKGLTKANVCKDLGIKKSTGYTWLSGKKIEPHASTILKPYTLQDYDLWHDLYSATDEIKLTHLLSKKYQFSDEQISELLDIDFKGMGWAEYSQKAIKKLSPYVRQGLKVKEAILQSYGKVDLGNDITLRNQLLEQVYESTQSLVEAIKKEYDIAEMQIELNPMLKQGNKIRKKSASGKRKRIKWEAEQKQFITDSGAEPTQYNYQKMQLWEEWNGYSPYEPNVKIDPKELFTDKYNIDHIVPKSKLMERGFSNQCLSRKQFNETKDQLTGIEFAEKLGILDEYKELIESLNLTDRKRNFLFMRSSEIPNNWVSDGAGTDYNTKCFLTLHDNAICIPNKLVQRYYREWQFNKYYDDDARSSLMKTLVVANMSKETIEYFDNLQSIGKHSVGRYDIKPYISEIEMPENIYMPSIKLYRKINGKYSPRFQLHKETVYGKRIKKVRNAKGEIVDETFYKVRKPILSLTKPMIGKISGGWEKKKLTELLEKHGTVERLMEYLSENPLKRNGKEVHNVSISVNANKLLPLHSTYGDGNTAPKKENERKIDFVYSFINALLGFWKEKGKTKFHSVPIITYIDDLNNGNKQEFDFWLMKNDVVRYNGALYSVATMSMPLDIRPLQQLSAEKGIKIGIGEIENIEKVTINQLGNELTKNKKRLQGNSEKNRQGYLFS